MVHRMPGTRANDLERLEILRAVAGSTRILGYPEGSIEFLREGEELATDLGEEKTLATFFSSIGHYYLVVGGDPALAKIYIEKSLSASELIGEVDIIAPAVLDLAQFYGVRGELSKICEVAPKCLELIEKTQTQCETFGMPVDVYSVLKAHYGLALGSIGSFDSGERAFADSHEYARQAGNPLALAFIELFHGAFYFFKGDGKNLVEHCKAGAEISEKCQLDLYQGIAWAWTGVGYLLLEQPEKALEHLEKGHQIHLNAGIHFFSGCINAYLGLAHLELGNPGKALVHTEQAVSLSRANNEENFLAQAEIYLGMVLGAHGPTRFDDAREHILRGIEIADRLKFKPMKAVGFLRLGELSASCGRVSEAAEHLQQAEAMFRQMGMDYWLGKTQNALANLSRSHIPFSPKSET